MSKMTRNHENLKEKKSELGAKGQRTIALFDLWRGTWPTQWITSPSTNI